MHVLNSSAASPIRITFDESRRAGVGGPQEIKMPGAEMQALKDAFEQIILAIGQTSISEGEKKEARSLLLKLLQSKAGVRALGENAQSLITKYFAGHSVFCLENSMVTARPILDRIAKLLSHREFIIGIWPLYLRSYRMDCRSMEQNDRGAA